jgi:hypothetical protein
MANQYTPYNNGTFEATSASLNFYRFGTINVTVGALTTTSEDKRTGAQGGVITVSSGFIGGPGSNPSVREAQTTYLRTPAGFATNSIILEVGKKYKAKCWVKVPSGSPIGTNNCFIVLGYTSFSSTAIAYETISGNRIRVYKTGSPANINQFVEYVGVKVGDAIDQWVQLEFTFIEQASGNRFFRLELHTYKFNGNAGPSGSYILDLTEGGTVVNQVLTGGKLFIDDITIDEVVECDLAPGSPSYTKTDETALNADDGTVTINATSSYTREYSKDNVTWQLSNLFENLAPGTYDFYVRDSAGCSFSIPNVVILPFEESEPPPPPPSSGALVINQEPLNKGNYISWFSATGDTGFTSYEFTNCFWDLPKGYRVNKYKNRKHYPCVVNGERFSFYINFDSNYNYPNFSSLRLYLFNKYGSVAANIGTLERVFQDDEVNYFIYASVTLSDIDKGKYRLAIVDESDDLAVLFVSNEIEVIEQTEADALTGRFRYRNSSTIFRFLYEKIADYYNEIRLRINVMEEQTEGKVEQYREVSTGIIRNTSFELDLFYAIETYFFDDLAHRATFVFQVHDIMLINDKLMILKTQYKPEWVQTREVCKGRIELYEQAFSSANRYGDPDVITINDAFLLGDNGGAIKL